MWVQIYRLSYCASETSLPLNAKFLSQQTPHIQIHELKGGTEGLCFLIEGIFKTIY